MSKLKMQTHKFSQLEKTCQTELLQLSKETTEDGWTIYKKQEDVIVYTKRLHKTDSIDCAKAVATLPFPAERIVDLLYNHIDVRFSKFFFTFLIESRRYHNQREKDC